PRYGATRSGMLLAVVPAMALVMAPLAGRWSDRMGSRALSVAGLVVACMGFVLLAGLGVAPATGRLVAALALVGGGLGLFTVPNTSALFAVAGTARTGTASG